MDEIPTLNELVTFIKLRNEKKIKRLAKHWGIRIDKDLRGSHGVKLESIFKKWLENEGTAATRGDVASALLAIEEREIHNSYCINIYSLQTSKPVSMMTVISDSVHQSHAACTACQLSAYWHMPLRGYE